MKESHTGVPPVIVNRAHAKDEHATFEKRCGAYLPHWTLDGAWYSVTFRLWDSLCHRILAV